MTEHDCPRCGHPMIPQAICGDFTVYHCWACGCETDPDGIILD